MPETARLGARQRKPGRTPLDDAALHVDAALKVLDDIESCPELDVKLGGLCTRLGFDYFSFVLADRHQLGDATLGTPRASDPMIANSYPKPWRERYGRARYDRVDPVVTIGSRTRRPFFWGDAEYLRHLSEPRRRVFDEARDFDIRSGYTVPLHGPTGECGLFSVSTAGEMSRCEAAVGESRHLLQLIGSQVYSLVVDRLCPATDVPELTEHERVCLSWTIRGKTAWEIAQILNRSRPTIDFHLQRAIRKLGAANKVHAAFKALHAGLI